ncbi:MAG: 3-isopropylmalate dehydrogenase [Treponema sp.]|nr:3-isopropylmalate dehydrogenase [Treponema sp.]
MILNLTLIPGDGIGPEVMGQAVKVLAKVCDKFGHTLKYETHLAGGAAIKERGTFLPDETLAAARKSDAVLFGAVGDFKYDTLPGDQRPENAILKLRKELGLYANLRPAILFKELADSSPVKKEITGGELDIMMVRELTGGIYFGEKGTKETPMGPAAYDVEIYSTEEIRRIAAAAFEIAAKRKKKVTSVDKANVLNSSRLWRSVVIETAKNYPGIELEHIYVDNAAMQLVRNPGHFDVIVTSNMFGDILSDEAGMIAGSLGMLPSASLGNGKFGLYEPAHGSAPDIAGQNKANPMAMILSAAMMLRYSFGLTREADAVENAVKSVLAGGVRTADIVGAGVKPVSTEEAGNLIGQKI